MDLTIDGYTLTNKEKLSLISECGKCTGKSAFEYCKNHKVEFVDDRVLFHNPDFYGYHFSIQKSK